MNVVVAKSRINTAIAHRCRDIPAAIVKTATRNATNAKLYRHSKFEATGRIGRIIAISARTTNATARTRCRQMNIASAMTMHAAQTKNAHTGAGPAM